MSEVKRPTEKNDRNAKGKELATSVPKVSIERDPKVTRKARQKSKKTAQFQARTNFT
jgi:hypothetical protein